MVKVNGWRLQHGVLWLRNSVHEVVEVNEWRLQHGRVSFRNSVYEVTFICAAVLKFCIFVFAVGSNACFVCCAASNVLHTCVRHYHDMKHQYLILRVYTEFHPFVWLLKLINGVTNQVLLPTYNLLDGSQSLLETHKVGRRLIGGFGVKRVLPREFRPSFKRTAIRRTYLTVLLSKASIHTVHSPQAANNRLHLPHAAISACCIGTFCGP